jgi:hypothetical protein
MSLKFRESGNKIVWQHPPAAQPAHQKLHTIADVLSRLENHPLYEMLRTVVAYVALCLELPPDQIPIDSLIDFRPRFKQFLQQRKQMLRAFTIKGYCDLAQMILREAGKLGWFPPGAPVQWEPVRIAMCKIGFGCPRFVRCAIRRGKLPSEFTDSDMDVCVRELVKGGLKLDYVRQTVYRFRGAVHKNGLAHLFPKLTFTPERPPYGIPLRDCPPVIRAEFESVLHFKMTDEFIEDRPWSVHIRPDTAKNTVSIFCRLYGYAVNVQKRTDIVGLRDLVTRDTVVRFVKFSLYERRVKGGPLGKFLWHLYAAMHHNPAYKDVELKWLPLLIKSIPPNGEDKKARHRQLAENVPWETLLAIPSKIRSKREAFEKHGGSGRRLAELVQDELLMSVLVFVGPWRQKNLRECRVDGNLFCAEIPSGRKIEIPRWVQERCEANPHEEFWQVRFGKNETKSKREVWFILPVELVSLVEEFLTKYRPSLMHGLDPGTVFVSRQGRSFNRSQVNKWVSSLTFEYAGCRVPPHQFRNAFSHWWVKNSPGDFNTLVKMLWDTDLNLAINTYAATYGVSAALERVKEVRRHVREQSELQPQKRADKMPKTLAAGIPNSVQRSTDDPQFSRCRRCDQRHYLNARGYCGPDCEHGPGAVRRIA